MSGEACMAPHGRTSFGWPLAFDASKQKCETPVRSLRYTREIHQPTSPSRKFAMYKCLPMLIAIVMVSAISKAASAACDNDCEFIKRVIADEPNRFRNLHDFDGMVTAYPFADGICNYKYHPFYKHSELSCVLTPSAKVSPQQTYEAIKQQLPQALGQRFTIAAEDQHMSNKVIAAVDSASGAKLELELLSGGGSSAVWIIITSRVFE
jgi:hypothetical protein